MTDIQQLINQLVGGDSAKVSEARKALEAAGKDAVEPLIAALSSANLVQTKTIIRLLGKLKDTRATQSVLTFLKNEDSDIRANAAFALVDLADPSGVETVKQAALVENDFKPRILAAGTQHADGFHRKEFAFVHHAGLQGD